MIDRKKQIEEAAKQFERDYQSNGYGFQLGAQWADANPSAPSSKVFLKDGMRCIAVVCSECGHEESIQDVSITPSTPFRELTREESAAAGKAAASFFDKPSGDDERDAKAYWTQEHISDSGEIFDAFLAGRKGMVPEAKFKQLQALFIERVHFDCIAEAVKAERERCLEIALEYSDRDFIRNAILNLSKDQTE